MQIIVYDFLKNILHNSSLLSKKSVKAYPSKVQNNGALTKEEQKTYFSHFQVVCQLSIQKMKESEISL